MYVRRRNRFVICEVSNCLQSLSVYCALYQKPNFIWKEGMASDIGADVIRISYHCQCKRHAHLCMGQVCDSAAPFRDCKELVTGAVILIIGPLLLSCTCLVGVRTSKAEAGHHSSSFPKRLNYSLMNRQDQHVFQDKVVYETTTH
jgi:hypothetical protein